MYKYKDTNISPQTGQAKTKNKEKYALLWQRAMLFYEDAHAGLQEQPRKRRSGARKLGQLEQREAGPSLHFQSDSSANLVIWTPFTNLDASSLFACVKYVGQGKSSNLGVYKYSARTKN